MADNERPGRDSRGESIRRILENRAGWRLGTWSAERDVGLLQPLLVHHPEVHRC